MLLLAIGVASVLLLLAVPFIVYGVVWVVVQGVMKVNDLIDKTNATRRRKP